MTDKIEMKIIGRIRTDFPTKFGIPRQSGVVKELKGRIVFEPEYRSAEAVRGIEGFSHLWLIWQFSENVREGWSPTVRPPILGGNTRVGVFATRSPFRPNSIGLSSVKLEKVELNTSEGPVLTVSGADLMDGTPILDIKPYIPYADSHPEATEGFRSGGWNRMLEVDIPPKLLEKVPVEQREALLGVLQNDPRPSYHHDPERVYGFPFGKMEIKFSVNDKKLKVIHVI
ncbi:tRNA (N6-threonylcarbamoyladenosine(37)-N6)-methyltransferase TrmO [Anaerovibrio sp.]|uniref:tRNA (N6-threonylcarbamoyladenosine(37)-N6)-methyltransferase TrmO n=1 Tax=Anaerovibrio sp. TaxID=1872532 RepID=UPI00388F0753